MEIYNFYDSWSLALMEMGADGLQQRLIGLAVGVVIWAALFILQGFGLYKMAKNRNMKNKWTAFVPFANIWLIGKLAGECDVFGHKMKRAGLYTMLAMILVIVFYVSIIGSEIYLYAAEGLPDRYYPEGLSNGAYMNMAIPTPMWDGLTGVSLQIYAYYEVAAYIVSIFQLVYEIMMVILLIGLYKKYYPKNYFLFAILALFIPMSRYIVIFALRNRTAIDYEAYMRARREAYMRQQQQYQNRYGNPYGGNPYGGNPYNQNPYNQNPYNQNPYHQNPYGNANQNTNTPPKQEDPFEEFSSKNKNGGNNAQNGGQGNGNSQNGDFFD